MHCLCMIKVLVIVILIGTWNVELEFELNSVRMGRVLLLFHVSQTASAVGSSHRPAPAGRLHEPPSFSQYRGAADPSLSIAEMDDSCAVCAEALEWVAYGVCGHQDVCSTCVVRLRFVLDDRRCCLCKTDNPFVFVTKAMGDYTRVITDFSLFLANATEGKVDEFWYDESAQAFFDDVDHCRIIRAMCRLSCSVCDKNVEEQGNEAMKRTKSKSIERLKGHLYHQHRLFICNPCLEGRKVFICEQNLYTRSQLNQHISTGDSEVDSSEGERGAFTGHPGCEFCKDTFYGDNELYMHMSTEHYTCCICQR